VNRIHRIAAVFFAFAAAAALAQRPLTPVEEIERYRAALGDGNPAELWEARGEALWKEKRGPKMASLEPRLVTCMVDLQGFTPEQAKKDPYGGPGKKVPMDALVAYVTGSSRGMKMNVSTSHPKEKEAYEIGQKIFHFRGGPHDFACATCHGVDNQRIRLQDLPNLLKQADAQKAYTAWPAYRVSQGELRSFQWRLFDCFRQQRFPELVFTSPASVALTMFLAKNANGGVFDAPSIKR
jgi:sulfur-oxidizing protein SoxA